jgi:hypothetical protein
MSSRSLLFSATPPLSGGGKPCPLEHLVRTRTMTASTALIGISGVHYVVSELSLRGMIALPTTRNTDAYDIVAITRKGDKHANIQVKTSSYRTRHWPMPEIEKIRTGTHDFYVLVRRHDAENRFEAFLLKGLEARKAVQETIKYQKENIRRGTRKSVYPAIDEDLDSRNLVRWKKAWERWSLERRRGT